MERLSKDQRKSKLRIWKEANRAEAEEAFPLANDVLGKFFDALESLVDQDGCDHTTHKAEAIAKELGLNESQEVQFLDWCSHNGGFCDCEIVLNTYGHWQENRSRGG